MVENHVSLKPTVSLEDNLDKVKVLHELSMQEEAMDLLAAVKRQIAGNSLTSQVVGKYVAQEASEREEIQFTSQQLNHMAVEFYRRKRMVSAANALVQALQLSPQNHSLAISLLKVMVKIRRSNQHTPDQVKLAEDTITRLDSVELTAKEAEAFKELRTMWKDLG